MSIRRPSKASRSVTAPRSPISGVAASTSTIGNRRRAAAMASPSFVWAFSRTRKASSSDWKVFRSTTRGVSVSPLMTFIIALSISSLLAAHSWLFPTVELDLVWPGRAFAGFEQRFKAQQENRPLGTAVVHELPGFLPALVLEQHDGPV